MNATSTISIRFTGFFSHGQISDARYQVVANKERRDCKNVPAGDPLTKWALICKAMTEAGWSVGTLKVYNGGTTEKGRFFERVQSYSK